jgi:tetratricopeptide (TPR) repeat protein
VPVEITMVGDTFQDAWQAGAGEWYANMDKAGFYPVHEAWKVYATAGTPAGIGEIQDLDRAAFTVRFDKELAAFVERELSPRVDRILLAMGDAPDSRLLNRLGILYARYGRTAEAETTFQKILSREPYVPALVNMGNLALLKSDFVRAASYFEAARAKAPDNASVLAGLTRASYGQGKLALANQYLASLKAKDPASADKLSFMGTGDQAERAADFESARRKVDWAETE